MITIYHKPGCISSQQVLNLIKSSGKRFRVIHYLENPLSFTDFDSLLEKLQLPAEALIRTKEPVWTEKFSKKKLSREQLIQAMVDHPILMQRPILVKRTRAIIGRPPELAAKWI